MRNRVGLLFSVFDGDQQHFSRFYKELERLKLPFVVNFDHCCTETKEMFKSHNYFIDGYENDDPRSFFDEMHRQHALNLLYNHHFDWAFQMDVDETLEIKAPQLIEQITSDPKTTDVVCCRVIDLWGDQHHYRTDGVFQGSKREKFFRISTTKGRFEYYHPTSHAPKILKPKAEVTCSISDLRVVHWGIMNMKDVRVHTERWNKIYERKVGRNPYGTYAYINDPNTVPRIIEVPKDVYEIV